MTTSFLLVLSVWAVIVQIGLKVRGVVTSKRKLVKMDGIWGALFLTCLAFENGGLSFLCGAAISYFSGFYFSLMILMSTFCVVFLRTKHEIRIPWSIFFCVLSGS